MSVRSSYCMEQWLKAGGSLRRWLAWFDTESIFQSHPSREAQVHAVVFVPAICWALVPVKTEELENMLLCTFFAWFLFYLQNWNILILTHHTAIAQLSRSFCFERSWAKLKYLGYNVKKDSLVEPESPLPANERRELFKATMKPLWHTSGVPWQRVGCAWLSVWLISFNAVWDWKTRRPEVGGAATC